MARASPASHAALIKAQQRARKAAPQGALGSPGMGSSRAQGRTATVAPRDLSRRRAVHGGETPNRDLGLTGKGKDSVSHLWRWWRQVPARQGSGTALGQGQLALSAHQPSLPDAACASHPCAWPLNTSLQPKGCPLSPHHCHCACTCSSHKPSPWWQDGDGDSDGEHPQSPSLEGKKESCGGGKIPPCEAGTLPATPGRAVAPLRRDGSASTEHL